MKTLFYSFFTFLLLTLTIQVYATTFNATAMVSAGAQLDIEVTYRQSTGNVHFTLVGPADRWFAFAFNPSGASPGMMGYTIEANSDNGVASERTMIFTGNPGSTQPNQNLTNITSSVSAGRITIDFDRQNVTGDAADFIFSDPPGTINLTYASPANPAPFFGYHGGGTGPKGITSLVFSQLPIKISSFDIVIEKANSILKWITESESNSAGFEVQRSTDGNSWEKLGYIEAQGESAQRNEYTYTDSDLFPGPNYYRLKMIDLNGEYEFSNIIVVDYSGPKPNDDILVYPTNTSDIIYIKSAAEIEGTVRVMIFNMAAQRLRDEFWAEAEMLMKINIADLPAGPYFISVISKDWSASKRVIKIDK